VTDEEIQREREEAERLIREINATIDDTAPQIEVAIPDESFPAKLLK
jgi:hypothetical protein